MESPYSISSNNGGSPLPPSPLSLSIKTPVVVSYEDMKDILKEYSIFEPDTVLKDDEERSVCIFIKDSTKYVLKLGNRDNRDDTTKYALLKNEADIYNELKNFSKEDAKHFPKVYDSGDIDNEFYFILMEFIEGKTLFDYVDEAFSTKTYKGEKEVLKILLNLTLVLKALWSGGIVHNDLSFENVMVESNLAVRLIDFEKSSKNIDLRFNTLGSTRNGVGYYYLIIATIKTIKDSEKYAPLIASIKKELYECEDPSCLTVYSKCAEHFKAAISALSATVGGRKKTRRKKFSRSRMSLLKF